MAKRKKNPSENDPTEPIRLKASRYPDVDQGTACTQSSFKTGKKAFLYIGMQGGRYKAMFKLQKSMPEAVRLASRQPDRFDVGSTAWVTARFTADEPMPKKLWETWLDESYELSRTGGTAKKPARKKAVSPKKKVAKKKKVVKRKVATKKKTVAKKKSGKKLAKKAAGNKKSRARTKGR